MHVLLNLGHDYIRETNKKPRIIAFLKFCNLGGTENDVIP